MSTENTVNQKEISAKVGRSQSWVSRVLSGKIIPKPEMAERLSKATNGRISPLEFLWPNGVPIGLAPSCPDNSISQETPPVTQNHQADYAPPSDEI